MLSTMVLSTAEYYRSVGWTQFASDFHCRASYNYTMYDIWADIVNPSSYKALCCAIIGMQSPWNRHFRAN